MYSLYYPALAGMNGIRIVYADGNPKCTTVYHFISIGFVLFVLLLVQS